MCRNVLAGNITISIAVKRPAELRKAFAEVWYADQVKAIHAKSMEEWQELWNNTTKGRWTYELIPELNEWIERKHVELDYYLTQMLAGHGCHREYLYKYKHVEDPFCLYCPDKTENARHVLLEFIRFTKQRTKIEHC